jgi:hypothetical protein
MNHLTSIELAELRRHELRVDAAHAGLAAATTTGGHPLWTH